MNNNPNQGGSKIHSGQKTARSDSEMGLKVFRIVCVFPNSGDRHIFSKSLSSHLEKSCLSFLLGVQGDIGSINAVSSPAVSAFLFGMRGDKNASIRSEGCSLATENGIDLRSAPSAQSNDYDMIFLPPYRHSPTVAPNNQTNPRCPKQSNKPTCSEGKQIDQTHMLEQIAM